MSVIQFNNAGVEHAIVFWGGGTYTASSSALGWPAINAGQQDTASHWRAASVGSQWIQVDKGSAQLIDSIGIAAHNAATSGVGSITMQYSSNGSSWTNIGTVNTLTNADIIALFPAVMCRYIRLSYSGPSFALGIFQAAKRIEFEHEVDISYTEIQNSITYTKEFNNSVAGYSLGNRVIARGASTDVNLEIQSRAFINGPFRQFQHHYGTGGCFFYAGAPAFSPDDMGYCWADGDDALVGLEVLNGGMFYNVSFPIQVSIT